MLVLLVSLQVRFSPEGAGKDKATLRWSIATAVASITGVNRILLFSSG